MRTHCDECGSEIHEGYHYCIAPLVGKIMPIAKNDLIDALKGLLIGRALTPMVYDEAYYFLFKSPDRKLWDAALAALTANGVDISKELEAARAEALKY